MHTALTLLQTEHNNTQNLNPQNINITKHKESNKKKATATSMYTMD